MALRRLERAGAHVLLTSRSMPEAPPWPVQEEVRDRLAAKLWALMRPGARGVSLYIDGHILLSSWTVLCDAARRSAFIGAPGIALGDLPFFAIDHDRLELPPLPEDYDELSSWVPPATAPPDDLRVLDHRRFEDRPWYFYRAAHAAEWMAEFGAFIGSDKDAPALLEADLRSGCVRPTLGYQWRNGVFDPLIRPETPLELDALFRIPEAAPTADQIAILHSPQFADRIARLRLENARRLKGRFRMEVSRFMKALHRTKKRIGLSLKNAAVNSARRLLRRG